MKIIEVNTRRRIAGISAGCVLAGAVAATITAPVASAAPDCSQDAVTNTVNAATGSAWGYLRDHPGANQAVMTAYTQPAAAESTLRDYFSANPGEYYELRGILAPIGETQRQCNVVALPAPLASAYDKFMAG